MLDYIGIFQKMKNAGALEQSRLPALPGAGDERIELPPKVLETPIIPFDQSPVSQATRSVYLGM